MGLRLARSWRPARGCRGVSAGGRVLPRGGRGADRPGGAAALSSRPSRRRASPSTGSRAGRGGRRGGEDAAAGAVEGRGRAGRQRAGRRRDAGTAPARPPIAVARPEGSGPDGHAEAQGRERDVPGGERGAPAGEGLGRGGRGGRLVVADLTCPVPGRGRGAVIDRRIPGQ